MDPPLNLTLGLVLSSKVRQPNLRQALLLR